LIYFQQKLGVPHAIQIVRQPGMCKKLQTGGFTQRVISADRWLSALP
jgi:hypothetical protein